MMKNLFLWLMAAMFSVFLAAVLVLPSAMPEQSQNVNADEVEQVSLDSMSPNSMDSNLEPLTEVNTLVIQAKEVAPVCDIEIAECSQENVLIYGQNQKFSDQNENYKYEYNWRFDSNENRNLPRLWFS